MRFGATNNPVMDLLSQIPTIKRMGFDYLELCIDPPEASPEKIATLQNELFSVMDGEGIRAETAHLPCFIWMADIYPSIRQASIDEVVKALETCQSLGIAKAVIHPGYLTGLLTRLPDQGRKLANESLALVLDSAKKMNVTLCLENMFPRSGHMYRPEEFIDVLNTFPDLMMTIDFGHARIQAGPDRLSQLIEAGGRRIRHVHLSDNTGKDDEHLPLGAGWVDTAGGLTALKNLGYDETITLEVFSPDPSLKEHSLRTARDMWEAA
jgi:sugar phosphate isomerase/epimerase